MEETNQQWKPPNSEESAMAQTECDRFRSAVVSVLESGNHADLPNDLLDHLNYCDLCQAWNDRPNKGLDSNAVKQMEEDARLFFQKLDADACAAYRLGYKKWEKDTDPSNPVNRSQELLDHENWCDTCRDWIWHKPDNVAEPDVDAGDVRAVSAFEDDGGVQSIKFVDEVDPSVGDDITSVKVY